MQNINLKQVVITSAAFFAGALFTSVLGSASESGASHAQKTRPFAEEMSFYLMEVYSKGGHFPQAYEPVTNCVGQVFVDSKLSDDALNNIVETDGEAMETFNQNLSPEERHLVESDAFLRSLDECVESSTVINGAPLATHWPRQCTDDDPVLDHDKCTGPALLAPPAINQNSSFTHGPGYQSRY